MSGGVVGDGSPTGARKRPDPRAYPVELVHGELCATRFGANAECDCGKSEPAASSGTGHDAALEPQLGDIVAVRTADGFWIRKIAMSPVMNGGDFPVVWVEWEGDEVSDGGEPWPSEDVRPLSEHPDALTREDFRAR